MPISRRRLKLASILTLRCSILRLSRPCPRRRKSWLAAAPISAAPVSALLCARALPSRTSHRLTPSGAPCLPSKSVAFPGKGASGLYFVSLLDRMGIKAEMQGKLKPMEAEDTVEVVARGEADLVVVVATRIMDVAGIDMVGPIPEELQTKIGFAAGLSSSTKEPDAAKALIRSSDRALGSRDVAGQKASIRSDRPCSLPALASTGLLAPFCAFIQSPLGVGEVFGVWWRKPMIKLVRVCAGLLLACGVATGASAQTKWDMPTPYPDGNFHTKNVIQFAFDVDKATNGSLKITVHSAGSLIKHPEIKRSVRQGTAPIGEMLESLSANEAAVYGLDSVPFLATGYDASRKLYDAQKSYLEKATRLGRPDAASIRCRGRRKVSTPSARSNRLMTSRV